MRYSHESSAKESINHLPIGDVVVTITLIDAMLLKRERDEGIKVGRSNPIAVQSIKQTTRSK